MAAEPRDLAGLLVAFDGSDASRAALERAAELFPGRAAVIATIWEPGLAFQSPAYESFASTPPPPDPRTVAAVDEAQREHAVQVAGAGAELAASLGLAAAPRPVADEVDVADTLIDLAGKMDAAAIVVGSHGITGLRSHIMGSVARKLLKHSRCPVVVVRHRE